MSKEQLKKIAVGFAMTAVSVAALIFIVNRFAPESVKSFYRVA